MSKTGTGNLSRKLITVLVLSTLSWAVAAQNVATGPNKVYLEQIGDSNTITIQQIGGTNNVGGTNGNVSVAVTGITTLTPDAPSASNYATVTGSSNQVTVTQTGDNNSAQYNIKGSDNTYSSTVTGNGNQTKLTMGTANVATTGSSVSETFVGNNNLAITNVVGANITSSLSVTGSSNQITQDLQSSRGNSTITINGSTNVINAEQTGAAGANGHVLVNNISTGDYNSITTQQQGTNDTTVNIQTAGDHNTITVRSSNSTISGTKTAVAR